MHAWSDVEAAAPDLAERVRARFSATGLGVLATLRHDGSPRVSGIEPLFAEGHVWFGSMAGARKAADLVRDPRMALHAVTADKALPDGDAKLAGRALLVTGEDFRVFTKAFAEATGSPPPDGEYPLFRVDLADVSFLRPNGDHLVIEWWNPREGYGSTKRY